MDPEHILTSAGFELFAEFYGEPADVNIGYRISEGAVLDAVYKHVQKVSLNCNPLRVFEFGAGTGVSGYRMAHTLQNLGLNIEWTATELNMAMIDQGRGREDTVPVVQADVQDLSIFPDSSFHVVASSQVFHWIHDIPKALREVYRVLEPEGLFVSSASGLFEGMGSFHFTEHAVYKRFLEYIESYLIANNIWNPDIDGRFEPANPNVNNYFHRYTVIDVLRMINEASFIEGALRYFEVPIDEKGMVDVRLQAGNTFMFLWNGTRTKEIPSDIANEAVNKARIAVLREYPQEVASLNSEPTSDATLRFTAVKPKM